MLLTLSAQNRNSQVNTIKMKGKDANKSHSKIPVAKVDGSLESAASFTRGGTPAAPDHDASERERASRIAAEQPRIIRWAEICGKLGGQLPSEDTSGGEHQVYYSFVAER